MSEKEKIILDTEVFQDEKARLSFDALLQSLANVHPKFIDRALFNRKRGNIIEQKGIQNWIPTFHLYLPLDVTHAELASITKRLAKIDPKSFDQHREALRKSIVWLYHALLRGNNKNIVPNEKDKNALLKKYFLLYQELFWDAEAKQLKSPEYRKSVLWEIYDTYEESKLEISESTTLDLQMLQMDVVGKIRDFLELSLFNKGVDLLRWNMMTLARSESDEAKREKCGDQVIVLTPPEELKTESELLRKRMDIDAWKEKLSKTRSSGSPQEIIQMEILVSNVILESLRTYTYQYRKSWEWFKPMGVLESKQVQCVGFAILWHAFFTELWIKHVVWNIPGHTMLILTIGGVTHLFDPWSTASQIAPITIMPWKWSHSIIIGKRETIGRVGTPSSVQYDLLSNMIKNMALGQETNPAFVNRLSKVEEALMYALVSIEKGQVETGLQQIDLWLKHYPDDISLLDLKWRTLYGLWKIPEAISSYNRLLAIIPDHIAGRWFLWKLFLEEWKNEEWHAILRPLLSDLEKKKPDSCDATTPSMIQFLRETLQNK
jgi:hypothetical protein